MKNIENFQSALNILFIAVYHAKLLAPSQEMKHRLEEVLETVRNLIENSKSSKGQG